MTNLTAETVADLFAQALAVARNGEQASPRGMATREVLDVNLRLTNPRARLLLTTIGSGSGRVLNPAFAAAECVWILSGSDDPWIFDYNGRLRKYADAGVLRGAYGPRMRRWSGRTDQLARVVEILRADPDSRRAVIQLYDPSKDSAGHKDVPCTLSFRFHLRRGRLDMATTMRSQDVWTGMPYDLFTFTVLHELVTGWLGAELGEYHHHVDSLHIYDRDLDAADAMTGTLASPQMEPLSTPWIGFDQLLRQVKAGERSGHPGWDTVGAVMRSYRLWRQDEQESAREVAVQVGGPLGRGLRSWYQELDRRRSFENATTTGTR